MFSARHAVTTLCSALGVTRQGYYAYRKRVAHIMRENGWHDATRGNARRPSGERRVARSAGASDLVRRGFSAGGPDEFERAHMEEGRPRAA